MNIISKVGQRDNVVTYEHICDTRADMSKIDRKYITLGSTCIVLAGESGAMEVYMADSEKEWHDILAGASNGSNTPSGLSIHICTQSEVSNGMPDIEFPLETELYLVPAREDSGNLYDEYVYVNGEWELFGGAPVNLTGYATQEWVSQQGYLTSHQSIPVQDVQVNGTSIVNNNVVNIPEASANEYGAVKVNSSFGIMSQGGTLKVYAAVANEAKAGTNTTKPIVPAHQHESTFYGLAKAAGDTTQAQSDNTVGTYTDGAKSAIQQMLGINTAIATAIGNIHSFDVQVVQTLPTQDIEDHTIYFVPKTGVTNDVYDEYLYINNQWEMIGNTQIDLTGYALTSAIPTRVSDLTDDSGHYTKPSGGIPASDLAETYATQTYVDNALAAKVVSVEGTTPAITAVADTQYICGEISTLSFTPSATGTCDVIFESGTTATVLTIPNTVKFPEWFDATALEANMTYEINITNGTYGAVMAWPAS